MPTYEFTCPNGHDFEKFFRTISSGESELPCPICGAIAQRKISAGAGLMFKGSGFYITDYGKDGKKEQPTGRKPASNGESASGSSSASDSSSGGESGSSSKASEGKSSDTASSKSDAKASTAPAAPKSETKASPPKSSSSSE
jgi:putative FmdB family regulatory protein